MSRDVSLTTLATRKHLFKHICSLTLMLQLAWSKDIHDGLTRDELAKSVPEAERLLELHQERKVTAGVVVSEICVGVETLSHCASVYTVLILTTSNMSSC